MSVLLIFIFIFLKIMISFIIGSGGCPQDLKGGGLLSSSAAVLVGLRGESVCGRSAVSMPHGLTALALAVSLSTVVGQEPEGQCEGRGCACTGIKYGRALSKNEQAVACLVLEPAGKKVRAVLAHAQLA